LREDGKSYGSTERGAGASNPFGYPRTRKLVDAAEETVPSGDRMIRKRVYRIVSQRFNINSVLITF